MEQNTGTPGREIEPASPGKQTITSYFKVKKQRLGWIDQGRGFVVFLLVFIELMPEGVKNFNQITRFFFAHPATDAPYISVYDAGVSAFMFVIGLLMSVSFKKRCEQKGIRNAVLNAVLRWGSIFGLGTGIAIISYGDFGTMKAVAPGVNMYVVSWDVINAIGFVGLLAIPFMLLPPRHRFITAYAMMAFYQAMIFMPETYWRAYAMASVHGGILGGIFVMTAIVLVGSCVGEYFVLNDQVSSHAKAIKLAWLGIANLAIGLGLWLVPGGFPNKRQSTMGWGTLSMAIVIGGLLGFVYQYKNIVVHKIINAVNNCRLALFNAFGQNSFFMYILTYGFIGIMEVIADAEGWLQVLAWLGSVGMLSVIALLLYKRHVVISTTKIAVVLFILLVVLALVLVPTGIIDVIKNMF
nr:hypothetical protein [Candidatus Sigynarchaeota archaeon]